LLRRLLSIFLIITLLFTSLPASQGDINQPKIHVFIEDLNSIPYDNVLVQVWTTTLVDSGLTIKGNWTSKALTGDTTYLVVFSTTEHTESREVAVKMIDVFIGIRMKRTVGIPKLILQNISFSPEKVMLGQNFTMGFDVANAGDSPALDSLLSIDINYPFVTLGTGSVIKLSAINASSKASSLISLSVDKEAKTGAYKLSYTLFYTDEFRGLHNSSGTFGIIVGGVPSLAISKVVIDPIDVRPGSDVKMRVSVANIGTETAYDVSVTLTGQTGEFTSTLAFLGVINRGSVDEAVFGISIPIGSTSGTRSINITATYRSPQNQLYTEKRLYTFIVFPIGAPQIKISEFSLDPMAPLMPGSTATLRIKIFNIGLDRATDVSIAMSGDTTGLSSSSTYIGELGVESTKLIEFNLKLGRTAAPGTFLITVKVTYSDSFGHNYIESQNYEYRIYPVGAPELKIQGINILPLKLVPGTEATLTVSLINVGTGTAKDVTIDISGWTKGFSTLSTYIGSISPSINGADKNVELFGLSIPYNMSSGTYSFVLKISYLDDYGKRYVGTYPYEFTVFQIGTPDVKIQSVHTLPLKLTQGVNGSINVILTNIGDGIAKDIVVRISDSSTMLTSTFGYAGRLDPNKNSTVSFSISVPKTAKQGTYNLTIALRYDDSSGLKYDDSEPFAISVFKAPLPIVKIQNILYDPTDLSQGTKGMATIFLENVGETQARDISVRISGGAYSVKPTSSTASRTSDFFSTDTFYVGVIDPGKTATVILNLDISTNAEIGTYLLRLAMTYRDSIDQTYQSSTFIENQIFPVEGIFTPTTMPVILIIVLVAGVASVGILRYRRNE